MALKKKPEDPPPGAPFWMTTYGDMVTLLLTFFILMFAMSTINEQKFFQAAASLSGALGIMDLNVSVIGERSMATGIGGARPQQMDMLQAMESIAEMFEQESLEDIASIEVVGPGEVVVRMGDEILFDAGSAELKQRAVRVITGIIDTFKGRTSRIWVQGHTDNEQINTPQFPSNWELSSARAISVVHLLSDLGVPRDQLAAVAFAEYQQLSPNETAAGRAQNRRVELHISWSE